MVRGALLFVVGALLAFFSACGTSDNERRTDALTETVIEPGEDDFADMDTGTRVDFPAGTFAEDTIVLMSDVLVRDEIDAAYFPEGALTILAALILNSPVDEIYRKNITFTWVLNNPAPGNSAWRVFRFDQKDDLIEWVELEGVIAIADPTAAFAKSVMPSSGVHGYSGTFALFIELPAESPQNIPPEFGPNGIESSAESFTAGTPVTFTCSVTDADGDELVISWDDGSVEFGEFTGATYEDDVATVEWTTSEPGGYTISIRVDDGSGIIMSISLEITVE